MTPAARPAGPARPRERLLLLGAGHAHVQVLAHLAHQRDPTLQVSVLTPFAHQTYSGMAPGVVAGRYTEDDGRIALAPLLQAAGATWVPGHGIHIDTARRRVRVAPSPGARDVPGWLPYDRLSIDTGGGIDPAWLEATMPGARDWALPVRPIEHFVQRWAQVAARAQQRALSVVVIGAGAGGVELAFAIAQRLRGVGDGGSRVTLLTGGTEVVASHPPGVRERVRRRLRRAGIDAIREACVRIEADRVHLSNGATLACDVPVLAVGTQAPGWLQASGLALGEQGHVRVNRFQQSISHPEVFAAGDVSERDDHPHARSGVYAVRAGPPLAHNLVAAHRGEPLRPHWPPQYTLNLLSCGTGHAIASWGPLHTEGAWVWRWKDRIDRGFIARYRPAGAGPVQQPS